MCLFFKARTDIARMGFAFYGPFAFVIGATQHVIANIGFLGLPLLLSRFTRRTAYAAGVGFGRPRTAHQHRDHHGGQFSRRHCLCRTAFSPVTRLQQNGR